ncbi:MAG: NADH:flavin oxidoreductase, partial [Xanthobacteraceae bacterium]
MNNDPIFQPIKFPHLEVKNRIFRSSISGRFDNEDGSGTQTRINWEEKFARGGVGAIITSFVPVTLGGRIMANYATIHSDNFVPFWKRVGQVVHRHDCKFIVQLSHSGRQQDGPGIANQHRKVLSSTSRPESLHGFPCQAMTRQEIKETVQAFADGARRARQAGLDGVELHGANGYLITQFLSSGINNRRDEYGGSLENRARFLREIVTAIRREVGHDFHLQVKVSAVDFNNVIPWERKGNKLEDTIEVCKWVEEDGANAVHISTGSLFPHPLN